MKPTHVLLILAFTSACSAQPDTLWTRYYGLNASEEVYGACMAFDGSVIVAGGGIFDSSQEHTAGFLVKVTPDGVTEWLRQFEADSIDDFRFVTPTSNGGFLAGGRGIFTRPRFIKTNSSGQSQWLFESPFDSYTLLDFGGIETADGRDIVFQSGDITGGLAIRLFCFDTAGDTIWSSGYSSDAFGSARAIFEEPQGFVLLGSMDHWDSTGGLYQDAFFLATDEVGHEISRQLYYEPNDDRTMAGDRDLEGGFYLSGYYQDLQSLQMYRFCRRINSNGETIWYRSGDFLGQGRSFTGKTLPDGSYLMGGGSNSRPYLMNIDADGNIRWYSEFPLPDPSAGTGLATGNDGSAYIAGYADRPSSGYDAFLLKTTPILRSEVRPLLLANFLLEQNYPNPFNSTTTIPLVLSHTSNVDLAVYDVLGREISIVHRGILEQGNHRFTLDLANQPSGKYFVRVITGDNQQTLPMILLK